jgi:hypothetical protein
VAKRETQRVEGERERGNVEVAVGQHLVVSGSTSGLSAALPSSDLDVLARVRSARARRRAPA